MGLDAVVENLVSLSRRDRRIRLGYLIDTGADVLFRLVRHFETAYPEISVEPQEFDFSDPTAGLADGATEVAIIGPPVDLPEHRMLILDAESWVACLPHVITVGATILVAIVAFSSPDGHQSFSVVFNGGTSEGSNPSSSRGWLPHSDRSSG